MRGEIMNINNTKNKQYKCKFSYALITLILIFVIMLGFSCSAFGDDEDNFKLISASMSVEYSSYSNEYDATITGKIKNISGNDYSFVEVEFSVYDSDGNNIGTADAFISSLGDGEVWSFEATLLWVSSRPVSFKLADITCW